MGMRLRVERARLGITLTEAEERTGVGRDTISALERGQRGAQVVTLNKLAKGYGVSVSKLLEEVPSGDA
jgi:transcriptional regulator with XRE-family HTH domain